MDWIEYLGKFISVLIDGKDGKEENYLGTVMDVVDGFMVLDTGKPNVIIDKIIFKTNLIRSVWIYKKDTPSGKKQFQRDRYGLGYPR